MLFYIRRSAVSIAVLVAVALVAQLLRPAPANVAGPKQEIEFQSPEMRLASSVPLSGAEPPYPLDHTFDGTLKRVEGAENSAFDADPSEVGTPPSNHNLEAPPALTAQVPNGDFANGNFSSWSVSGSPTLPSDPGRGYWAKFTSTGSLTTEAIAIPVVGNSLGYDINYSSTTGYSTVDVYVLSGPNFATSTKVKTDSCNRCGRWGTSYVDLAAYKGQTIKVKFSRYAGTVGLDNVGIKEAFPGFVPSGSFQRVQATDGGTYAGLDSGAHLTSPVFTVDPEAQYGIVKIKGNGTSHHKILVATAPDFSTFTQVALGTAPTTWQGVRFNLSEWRGEQIKVRVQSNVQHIDVDDIATFVLEVPGWDVTGDTTLVDDGSGDKYVRTKGTLISSAIEVTEGVQNISVDVRSPDAGSFWIELLRGQNYSTVVQLDYEIGGANWETFTFGLGPYQGESVKLRVRKYSGGETEVDNAGIVESGLQGWKTTTTGGAAVGEDGFGTYVAPAGSLPAYLRSSWISPGIIDRSSYVDWRFYAISYAYESSGTSLVSVYWNNDEGDSYTVFQDAADGPEGYTTKYFHLFDSSAGERGYFVVKVLGSAKVYSIADNIARQQLSEPFSRKVGMGIDTSTGSVSFSEQDISVEGAIPLTFKRYYNAHSDHLGTLGYRWSHTYDTKLVFGEVGQVAVVFGSGREELFDDNYDGSYDAVDVRVHSKLAKEPDGSYRLTTKDNLTYHFTAQGVLNRIEDLNGNALVLAYDGQGRLTTVSADGNRSLAFSYNSQGRLSTLTDPAGSTHTFSYDIEGDLSAVTDPEGGVRRYAYDRHRLTNVIDENGDVEVENSYDEFSRVTSQTDASGNSIAVAYDAPGKGATKVTDPEGGVAFYHFDQYQRSTDAIDPAGQVMSFAYDTNGNLTKIIDPINKSWAFAFDASANLTSATDPLGNPVSFTYNPEHLPRTITDARGNVTQLAYDAQGNLISVTDPLGNVSSYAYDASGNVTSATDPLGNTTTYTYNEAGNRTSKTDAQGKTWTYTYNGAGRLTSETDPLGNTTRYIYDLLGRKIAERDQLGRETTFLYDFVGHLLMIEDPEGDRTIWDYDARGLAVQKTDPAGQITTYTYDDNRRMTSLTDPLGNTTGYSYDDAGRLTSITDPGNNTTTYSYDGAGRLVSKTDPLGRRTSYSYDAAGRPIGVILPNDSTLTYTYDADGNLLSATDALGNETTFSYDALSRMTSEVDPLGNRTGRSYDAAGRLIGETDPLNNETTFGYDAVGRMVAETDALGNNTEMSYDAAGRLVATTDPSGRQTRFSLDAAGQIVEKINPAGGVTRYSYNPGGNLSEVTNPSGAKTTYDYNARGLLSSVTDPLLRTTSYSYDGGGNLLSETDPMGHATTYTYDASGSVTQLTDAIGATVRFGYDAVGQMVSRTDPRGETWTFRYDALGNRTAVTDPLGRTTSYSYDTKGRQSSRSDARGVTTSYGYNANDLLKRIDYPGGSVVNDYDAASRLIGMTDETGSTSFAYDAADRMVSVAAPQGTIGYGYDAAGRRTRMTLPQNRTVDYDYDSGGRLASVTDWASRTVSLGYDADGHRTSITRPNGVNSDYTYDPAGQLSSISHKKGTQELLKFAYTYNAAGNRTSVTTTEGNEAYTYDAVGRLTNVTYPGGASVAYTYDAAGNRTSATQAGTTVNYTYDRAGQLTTAGNKSYNYDSNGNLVSSGDASYTWDWDNRLSSVTDGTHSFSYSYDGQGVRTKSTKGGVGTSYLVDRQGGLPTVVDDGPRAYLHAGGLLSQVDSSTATYALTDGIGSVRGLADGSGALVGEASYEVFGGLRSSTGATSMFGFAGEPRDEIGLTHLRARYLDPSTGRFLSPDTVQPNAPGTQGYNLYAYVANNPTNWVDPTGHLPVCENGCLLAVVASLFAAAVWGGYSLGLAGTAALGLGILIGLAFATLVCVFIEGCREFMLEYLEIHIGSGSDGEVDDPDTIPGTPPGEPEPEPDPSPPPLPCPPTLPNCGSDTGTGPKGDQIVYRVWGVPGAREMGRFWTPIDPRIYGPDKYRDVAGLPDRANPGTKLTIARITDPSGIRVGRAAPILASSGRSYCDYEGGLPEYEIPNAELHLQRVSLPITLSPPYGGSPPGGCP